MSDLEKLAAQLAEEDRVSMLWDKWLGRAMAPFTVLWTAFVVWLAVRH
jgi:hypothetical protein